MVQIAAGEAHASEPNQTLGQSARRTFEGGLWAIYSQLEQDSPRVCASTVDLLALVETDSDRLLKVSELLLSEDPSVEVQRAIARLAR